MATYTVKAFFENDTTTCINNEGVKDKPGTKMNDSLTAFNAMCSAFQRYTYGAESDTNNILESVEVRLDGSTLYKLTRFS